MIITMNLSNVDLVLLTLIAGGIIGLALVCSLYLRHKKSLRNTESKEQYYLSLLNKHGVCTDCGEMYSHEMEGPFAGCGCCTSEWYTYTPFMKLEEKIYRAVHAPLPALPVAHDSVKDVSLYTWTQMCQHANDTREAIIKHLVSPTSIEGNAGPSGGVGYLNPEGQPGNLGHNGDPL